MTVRGAEKNSLAGKLIVGLAGPEVAAAEKQWLIQYRPAGVILFSRNVVSRGQLAGLCSDLKDILGTAAEIVADHEGGAVSVLAAALGRPPALFGLGCLDDPDLTRQVHRDTACELRAVGVDRVLAPCADVLVEPRNPVIGSRAFGGDIQLVTRHVAAAVKGLLEGGVDCCLKHWPGHGGTRLDSHEGPVEPGRGSLDLPFQSGLEAGATALLVGHIPWSSGAVADKVPATLDSQALAAARHLAPSISLRLYADDVTMGALRPVQPGKGLLDPADLPRSWFDPLVAAGCDFLLCRGIPWSALPLDIPGGELAQPAAGGPAASPIRGGQRDDQARKAAWPEAKWPGTEWSLKQWPVTEWPASYAEARRRLVATTTKGFPPANPSDPTVVLWWDATPGDRWGDASSLQEVFRHHGWTWWTLGPDHGAPGSIPARIGTESSASDEPYHFLLVTSHRPLDLVPLSNALLNLPLAPAGRVLVMGHPSLGQEVAPLIPPAWSVVTVYEIGPEDLQAWLDFPS